MNEKKLNRIVVGTDFNDLSTAALGFAAGIAARAGAELTVVYADAFDPPAEFTATQLRGIAASIERSKIAAREQLERYVAKHVASGIRWKALVVENLPATAIAATAEAEGADFIALGTHGRGGLHRLVVGSVADTVIREATVPVLTVRSTPPPAALRRILCPVNEKETARAAVERAAQIARATSSELTLLNVCVAGCSTAFDIESLVPAGVKTTIVSRDVAHDDVAAEILGLESEGNYDLIVLGAEHRRVRDMTIFGTTTASVTRHARTPVLTVALPTGRRRGAVEEKELHAV